MKHLKSVGSIILKRYFTPSKQWLGKNIYTQASLLKHNMIGCPALQTISTKRYIHDYYEFDDTEDPYHIIEYEEEEVINAPTPVKYVLLPNPSDTLLRKLNNSLSVREVLTLVAEHEEKMEASHIAQTVLVLWDLQNMFFHVSSSTNDQSKLKKLNEDYHKELYQHESFKKILTLIVNKHEQFNLDEISCILLYLSKMGVSLKDRHLQLMIETYKNKVGSEKLSLEALSRFVVAISTICDLSWIYILQDMIPLIYGQIDNCSTSNDFKLTTICLNHMSQLVTDDILTKYTTKTDELFHKGVLNRNEYKTILKIILFLNHPHWRDKNITFTSSCMRLLKSSFHLLNIKELLLLHQVLYKNQEPGDILNELQRCSSKYLLQLEEEMSPLIELRLKLFTSIVYFSPPLQRPHFEKIITKYLSYELNSHSLLELCKVLIFTKITETSICRTFWTKTLLSLEEEGFKEANVLKICHNYVQFNQDKNLFRHKKLEDKLLKWLEDEINHGISIFIPAKLSTITSFLLIYGQQDLLRFIIRKIKENINILNFIDCLNISQSLHIAIKVNKLLTSEDIHDIKLCLTKCTYRLLEGTINLNETNFLLKSLILRNSNNTELHYKLISNYNTYERLTSKTLKHIVYCLYNSDILLPNIINKMCKCIIEHKDGVLGFNVERVIYLCYYFGYLPENSVQFFDSVMEVILRDMKRLSGLSHIQACLSLSYFGVLPQSFIQQIFNVEFLEKLDVELTNCYFKETYPFRVKQSVMELNRAVCLDYPEANVPWFHEKYVQDIKDKVKQENETELSYTLKKNLSKINGVQFIKQNDISAYGYHIDFVINLDSEKNITDSDNACSKIAILLIRPNAYTKLNVQLKGNYQLKIRHLEMLGYKVVLLDYNKWINAVTDEEKTNYLKDLISLVAPYSDVIVNR